MSSITPLSASANGYPGYSSILPAQAEHKRTIGVFSAVFIIFNRIIGTGIFATPSTILSQSGSVGLSLIMWLIGAAIASAGMQVYIVWGTALPHNGGEKNYLEYLFPRPARFITSIYAANAVLLAYAAGNSLVFAEYTLKSIAPDLLVSWSMSWISPVRLLAFLCLTSAMLLHGLHVSAGLRLQNILGVTKIGILGVVVATGLVAASGRLADGVEPPQNFSSWERIWEGSRGGGSIVCSCLYNVIWSFVGFSNANYALSEMHRPERTLRIAGPIAIAVVTMFYLACNFAYFSAASKEEITRSGRLVASVLFRNVWGEQTERILSAFVALSALGNVLSVSFSQGRVNQSLGREGILFFNKMWANDWPRNAPLAGLALHWLVCNIVVFSVPAGDAYNFVLNLISYPLAVINAVISFGLVFVVLRSESRVTEPRMDQKFSLFPLSTPRFVSYLLAQSPYQQLPSPPPPIIDWTVPTDVEFPRASPMLITSALFFAMSNVFLFVFPFVRPPAGAEPYQHLPYWTHAAGGWAVFVAGSLWWLLRTRRRD